MSAANLPISADQKAAIRRGLLERPDGVIETLAGEAGVCVQAVLDCLHADQAKRVDGSAFERIWDDLIEWGEITFIVHTEDGVFECKGSLPAGKPAKGYFNIHGDSPISGHIRRDRCRAIYFVDRQFFGKRSCSLQFVNAEGKVMFKIFVGRATDRSLLPEQVSRFESLRARL